jgi:hypothetical protein
MIVATTENGTPASSIRVHPVCLKSWNRQATPARAFADSHASFQRPIGLVGSLSYTTVAPSPEVPIAFRRKNKMAGFS